MAYEYRELPVIVQVDGGHIITDMAAFKAEWAADGWEYYNMVTLP
jgi:hypothetical protein